MNMPLNAKNASTRLVARKSRTAEAGFTIVELMIATLVFSVILIVVTVGVISFARAYQKGVNTASTQNTARTAMDRISQAIQFNGGVISYATAGVPTDPITTYCIGAYQYDFVRGVQKIPSSHVLYETPRNTSTPCTPQSFSATSKDLVGEHMRLADLSVTPSSGVDGFFVVHVRVVFGDDDLLTSPATAADTTCTAQKGTEYCAVADLKTAVVKRIK